MTRHLLRVRPLHRQRSHFAAVDVLRSRRAQTASANLKVVIVHVHHLHHLVVEAYVCASADDKTLYVSKLQYCVCLSVMCVYVCASADSKTLYEIRTSAKYSTVSVCLSVMCVCRSRCRGVRMRICYKYQSVGIPAYDNGNIGA